LKTPTSCGSTIESPPPETRKLLVEAQQMADATMSVVNTNQTPTARASAGGPSQGGHSQGVVVVVMAAAAAAEAPPMALAEELVAVAITEVEAM
jgi:hypothetical protein